MADTMDGTSTRVDAARAAGLYALESEITLCADRRCRHPKARHISLHFITHAHDGACSVKRCFCERFVPPETP
jgi:hypothetical protein